MNKGVRLKVGGDQERLRLSEEGSECRVLSSELEIRDSGEND